MARKSQALIAAESEIAQLKTQVGVLMSQLEASNQARKALQDERDDLIIENQRLVESCVAAHERCDALEAIVATKSAPQPQRQAAVSKPLPSPAVAESAPPIEITAEDHRIWSAFKALPREKRQSYYEFARATVGHLGIHNIVAVREAYLAQQAA